MLEGKDANSGYLMQGHKIRHLGVAAEARLILKGNYKLYCVCHRVHGNS